MDTDKAMQSLGKYSRFQLLSYCAVCFVMCFMFAWNVMSIVFIGDSPNYRCRIADNATVNSSIPLVTVAGIESLSQCSMYEEPGVDNRTVPCQHGYWYDPESGYDSTLVTEFDLACGKTWMVELSITITTIGSTVSTLFSTRLADLFGRKIVTLISIWVMVFFMVVQAFSYGMYMYIAAGFFVGMCQQGILTAGFIHAIELFNTEQRTFAGMAMEFFWALAYMVLPLIAYYVRNWRHLQLALSLPFLVSVSLYWLISESLPWLIANKKYKEAKKVLARAHRINKTQVPDDLLAEGVPLKEDEGVDSGLPPSDHNANPKTDLETEVKKDETDVGFLDILKSKKLLLYTLILTYIWFVNGFVYFAQSLTVTYLPGDRYLNTFLYAMLEVPAYIVCWILIYFIGRVKPLCAFMVITGLALIGTVITSFDCCSHWWQLTLVLNMVAKFCISSSFAAVFVQTPEIYPTNIRGIGLGITSFGNKVATFLSPYSRIMYRTGIPWLVPVILGFLCLIAGVLTPLLPETRYTKLPETLQDVDDMQSKKRGGTVDNRPV